MGALLLRSGDATASERVFREEIARHPNSGRALWGLSQALGAQGKKDESEQSRRQFQKAWKYADVKLRLEGL